VGQAVPDAPGTLGGEYLRVGTKGMVHSDGRVGCRVRVRRGRLMNQGKPLLCLQQRPHSSYVSVINYNFATIKLPKLVSGALGRICKLTLECKQSIRIF